MKQFFAFAIFAVLLTNCGRDYKGFQDTGSYLVNDQLNASGRVTFSYDLAYNFRSITVGREQSDRCRDIAADYSARTGTSLALESLKLSYSEPQKNCLHRNAVKACENSEYVYTFNCQYSTGN